MPIRRARSCARAASGHAAPAPPSSVMNSRRFTADASVLPTERIAHLSRAEDCCAAGFQSGLCRFGVRRFEWVPFATFPLWVVD